MSVIFKPIRTAGGYYVYDRSMNSVIRINKSEYQELCNVEEGKLSQEQSEVIKHYQENNYFKENEIEIIEHPCSNILEHMLSYHIEQLTLQVTQRCNLRCKYCTYSGIYHNGNRTHANYDMDYDMAKAAIDFYLERSMEMNTLTFGFYGGEPLLRFELIKQCVNYIKSRVKNREIHFTITNNGTLLTPEIAEFLLNNNFSIIVSLDGSKQEHDEYRVFADGSGSFDKIMNNIKVLLDKYPDLFKKLHFNTVLNPKNNYKHIKLYFEEDELVGSAEVMTTLVDNKSPEKVQFADEFYRATAYDRFKLYLFMLNKLDIQYVSKLVISQYAYLGQKYKLFRNNIETGCKAHPGGPCIPGGKRLFINVFGEMFPCERVVETSEVMKIGNLKTGLNFTKAINLLNVGKVTEKQCKNCWALHYCSICCQKADGGDKLSDKIKIPYCTNSRENAYNDISEICVLRELGCTFEEKGIKFYENSNLPYYIQ